MVSIIIPVFNVEKYLSRCIESVLVQKYIDMEIILVDDGSPDNCPKLCDEYEKKDRRIKVIHKKNGGLSSARNAGLEICEGDYIFFIDSDDWLTDENVINDFITKAENEKSDFVYSLMNRVYDETKVEQKMNTRFNENDLYFLSNPYLFSAWNKLYSRSLLPYLKFEPGRINEDVDVIPLVFSKAKKVSNILRPTYNYYCNPSSITKSNFSQKRFDMFKSVKHVYDNFMGTDVQKKVLYENLFGFQLFSVYIEILKIPARQERKKYLKQFISLLREYNFDIFYKYSFTCFIHNEVFYKKVKKLFALIYLRLFIIGVGARR